MGPIYHDSSVDYENVEADVENKERLKWKNFKKIVMRFDSFSIGTDNILFGTNEATDSKVLGTC